MVREPIDLPWPDSSGDGGEAPVQGPSRDRSGTTTSSTRGEAPSKRSFFGFVDELCLGVESGQGGAGCVAWRRERHIRRGGPAGGNGGRGGSVVLQADQGLSTLLDLQHRRILRAARGRSGGPACRTGASACDLVVRVPAGTLVEDPESGEVLADLREHGQRVVVARGGRGGRGNAAFTSSTRRSPDLAEPGQPGESHEIRLNLKLLADVGIVGMPNAGKSTLISKISNARPKIADYPFTTLVPNLGVVNAWESVFVVADIPGLIEGAVEGAGLGFRFLRHIERTALFLFLLDHGPERPDPLHDLQLLEQELERYDPELAGRQRVVALNKIDLPEVRAAFPGMKDALASRGLPVVAISAVTGEGLPELLHLLVEELGLGAG